MPAGSGPQITRVTTGAPAAAELALATIAGSWQEVLGILLSCSVNFTPGTAQTSTSLRLRQGNGTGGALVGIVHTVATIAAAPIELAIQEQDTSAFGQAQIAGQYTLTIQTNAAGPGAINAALLELETIAPVI